MVGWRLVGSLGVSDRLGIVERGRAHAALKIGVHNASTTRASAGGLVCSAASKQQLGHFDFFASVPPLGGLAYDAAFFRVAAPSTAPILGGLRAYSF
jgi:hypothetical protein